MNDLDLAFIDRLIPGGQGIATLKSGKKALLWNALPGENVRFKVLKNKSSYLEGVATQILQPSPKRVPAKDPVFLSTSPWQILDFNAELEAKATLTQECFREQGLHIAVPRTISDGKDYFYRNKMEYALYFDHQDQQIHLAFHARGSHRKIAITQSSLELPAVFAAASAKLKEMNANKLDARLFQSLLVRANAKGETRVALFAKHQSHPVLPPLQDTLLGQSFTYAPTGFFQINLPLYSLVLSKIKTFINTQKVLDLYAGVGSIGFSVAREHDLTLVEIDKHAFGELKNNAAAAPQARAVLAPAEAVTDFITADTTVILDPPRAGCDAKLINRIKTVLPPTVIYLSCNPITQARDLKALCPHPYHIDYLQPFDFFPHTPHVENLVLMSRAD